MLEPLRVLKVDEPGGIVRIRRTHFANFLQTVAHSVNVVDVQEMQSAVGIRISVLKAKALSMLVENLNIGSVVMI